MQTGITKGFRPLFIKRLAMLIGICYLAYPVHDQFSTLVQHISHHLEVPNYIMGHQDNGKPVSIEHELHVHEKINADHSHLLANLMDTIFEAADGSDGPDTPLVPQEKIDKHMATPSFKIERPILRQGRSVFGPDIATYKNDYFQKIEKPPNTSSAT